MTKRIRPSIQYARAVSRSINLIYRYSVWSGRLEAICANPKVHLKDRPKIREGIIVLNRSKDDRFGHIFLEFFTKQLCEPILTIDFRGQYACITSIRIPSTEELTEIDKVLLLLATIKARRIKHEKIKSRNALSFLDFFFETFGIKTKRRKETIQIKDFALLPGEKIFLEDDRLIEFNKTLSIGANTNDGVIRDRTKITEKFNIMPTAIQKELFVNRLNRLAQWGPFISDIYTETTI